MYKINVLSFIFKLSLSGSILCCGLIVEHPYLRNNFIYEHTLPAPHKFSFSCHSREPRKKSCFKPTLKMTLIGNKQFFTVWVCSDLDLCGVDRLDGWRGGIKLSTFPCITFPGERENCPPQAGSPNGSCWMSVRSPSLLLTVPTKQRD